MLTLSTTGDLAVAVLRLTLSPGSRPEAPKHSPGPHLSIGGLATRADFLCAGAWFCLCRQPFAF
jgi:hypothetical protein